jgi:protein gp37
MNAQNKDKIAYCHYTLNPLRCVCRHGCAYCYVKDIKRVVQPVEPFLDINKLDEPSYIKTPKVIFVGNMTDVFGNWVPSWMIDACIDMTIKYSRHAYIFLTKNPLRYSEFNFTDTTILGTTIDYPDKNGDERIGDVYHAAAKSGGMSSTRPMTMVSFEPLLGDPTGLDLTYVDWIIIGECNHQDKRVYPTKSKWVEWLIDAAHNGRSHIPVFVKKPLYSSYAIQELPSLHHFDSLRRDDKWKKE